jgi:hypothetical protein
MLALKKKREAEAKIAAEEKAEADKMEVEAPASAVGPAKVSLLGIGGKKKTKNGDSKTAGKKRSPGEIRIQKGTFPYSNNSNNKRTPTWSMTFLCPSARHLTLALHLHLTTYPY